MTDLKDVLLDKLREARAGVVAALDGLGEYDVRRPMTPSGTNLLGLVKHLVGNEHVLGLYERACAHSDATVAADGFR